MSAKVRTSPTKTPAAGPVSKAEFARQMHVTRQAVSTWIARKQLKWPALRRDGRVDAVKARKMLADAAAGLGREGAAARAGAAEDAVSSRLARARADLLAVKADERTFAAAVDAGTYLACEDAGRPIARTLSDLMSAIESWAPTVASMILSTDDDGQALERGRASFDSAWLRVRGVDDRSRNGQAHPSAVPEVRNKAVEDSATAAPARAEGPAHAPARRRAEDEAARLARLRCEKAEAAAGDARRAFQQHLGGYLDAEAWRRDVAAGFRGMRAKIEAALPGLVEAVRSAAGDGRRAALAARAWSRAVRAAMHARSYGVGKSTISRLA
jgi:hypothetical protein